MTAPPGDVPRLRQQAIEILRGIENELMIAVLNRQLYQEVRDEIVRLKPSSDATWLNSYSGVYARAQLMVIRRLADDDPQSDSLWRLIERIRVNPAIAAREALVEAVRQRSDDYLADDADRHLSRLYGGAAVPGEDLLVGLQKRLREDLATVITYVDRSVAHRDPRGPRESLTFGEIHAAIDDEINVANEVSMMLTYGRMDYREVTIQGDWQECLRPGLFPVPPDGYYWPDPEGYV